MLRKKLREFLVDTIKNGKANLDDAGRLFFELEAMESRLPKNAERFCAHCGAKAYEEVEEENGVRKHRLIAMEYMLKDAIWREAGFSHHDIACLGCVEQRLGRNMTLDDFNPYPINTMVKWLLSKKRFDDNGNLLP